jgi:hypothetical protein
VRSACPHAPLWFHNGGHSPPSPRWPAVPTRLRLCSLLRRQRRSPCQPVLGAR